MIQHTILILMIVVVPVAELQQPKTGTDWETLRLKGRVKSVYEEQCRILKTDKLQQCKVRQKTVFNEKGFKLYEVRWEYSKQIDSSAYYYDFHTGRLSRMETFLANQAVRRTEGYQYNSKGQLSEVKIVTDRGPDSRYTFQYDANNRRIQMDGYNLREGEKHFIKETTAYDNFGNPVRETSEHETGNSVTTHRYTYGTAGRILTHITSTDSKAVGKYSATVRYEYDAQGNIIAEYSRGKKTALTYDESGNWIVRDAEESKDTSLLIRRTIGYF